MWQKRRQVGIDTFWMTRDWLKTVILIDRGLVVDLTELVDDFFASGSLLRTHSEHLLFYEVEDVDEELRDLRSLTQAFKLL